MTDTVLLIGAGFSKPAGLPLAKEINEYFLRDNTEMVLNFSSGEYKWYDLADKTDQHNGRIHYNYIAYGILLTEFVKIYLEENEEFTNYEEFYQYTIDNISDHNIQARLSLSCMRKFNNMYPDIEEEWRERYTEKIRKFQVSEFVSMINHLIGDLLYARIPADEKIAIYRTFCEYIDDLKSYDVITLNHDLIMESLLLNVLKKEYSDGFSTDQQTLKSDKGISLNLFQNRFDKKVSLIKLHGSLDNYKYIVFEPSEGLIRPTGEYYYFKTRDYNEKQKPYRYNPDSGELVQNFHWDIQPQFITGINKEELIAGDQMYSDLLAHAEDKILACSTLIIIGYSFSDKHINAILKKALKASESLTKVININPSIRFPFEVNRLSVEELSSINELTK